MPLLRTLPLQANLGQVTNFQANIVIIDVLRACTSAVVAFENGAKSIYPCSSREEARGLREQLCKQGAGPLLCGERGGRKIEGFDLGNSPREFTREIVGSRVIIMATTNGTKALKGAEAWGQKHKNSWIGIAAYVNASAVAQKLSEAGGNCLLVCSGKEGFFSLEDFVGAGLVLDELLNRPEGKEWKMDDASRAAHEIYQQHKSNLLRLLETCSHGDYLINCGFGEDLPVCAEVNRSNCVPTYVHGKLLAG